MPLPGLLLLLSLIFASGVEANTRSLSLVMDPGYNCGEILLPEFKEAGNKANDLLLTAWANTEPRGLSSRYTDSDRKDRVGFESTGRVKGFARGTAAGVEVRFSRTEDGLVRSQVIFWVSPETKELMTRDFTTHVVFAVEAELMRLRPDSGAIYELLHSEDRVEFVLHQSSPSLLEEIQQAIRVLKQLAPPRPYSSEISLVSSQ